MRSSRSTPAGEFPVRIIGAGVLLQAARDGDYEIVKKSIKASIFKKGEDVNRRDDRECTALHYAVKISHVGITKLLLDKGADLQAEDKHGWSVLHYAVRYGNETILEFLLNRGADIHAKEKRGWNVLHIAARNGQSDKARLLLENEIDVHEYQSQGWNALHLAVRYGQPDTISTLLEYGININADNGGWTALHLAALNGHMDIVSILLNKGANSAILNRDGKMALDIARDEEHERIAAIIIETEFQGNNPDLPSPPPTPPSAPPLEFFGATANTNSADTFDQWKIKLQRDLENISNDDSSSEKASSTCGEGVDSKDIRYSWKSFEEEKLELLQQLEKVRLKEVTRISEEIQKKKDKHQVSMLRMEKQKHLLHAQIDNMRSNIPNTKESGRIKYQTLKEDITQISALIENSAAETDLIENLKSLQIETEFCEVTRQKKDIVEQLAQVQLLEREQLEAIKREKYHEIDVCESSAERDVTKIGKRIKILEDELESLVKEKAKKDKKQTETIVKLKEDLVKAERQRVIAQKEEDEDQFACPVCMELLKPPLRIFQCPEGHILCENCKENPSLVHCPQCRVPLERNCSRNRALEEVARTFFPANVQTKL
eukprot:TRINITY_DN14856_c0_g1_i1.p1 TRINITY_DN14856_c0_g1~~TRINITY_DN14856_c0_g1_i1.p1  ORF type:complete len:604 (+),score=165.54 TRINITY_DN14856_c0_g1_i1:579-2390(+)